MATINFWLAKRLIQDSARTTVCIWRVVATTASWTERLGVLLPARIMIASFWEQLYRSWPNARGVGAGPAGTAAAGPMLEAKLMNLIKGWLQKFWLSNNLAQRSHVVACPRPRRTSHDMLPTPLTLVVSWFQDASEMLFVMALVLPWLQRCFKDGLVA